MNKEIESYKLKIPTKEEIEHNLETIKKYNDVLTQKILKCERKVKKRKERKEREELEILNKKRKEEYEQEKKRLEKMTPEEISRESIVKLMKNIFEKHVPSKKKFNEEAVIDKSDINNTHYDCYIIPATKRGEYEYNGVEIHYLSRLLYYKGDSDMFTDYSVKIDGKTIIKVEKE
jgi:hypothetical protein